MATLPNGLTLPDDELVFSTTRSSGPGGQNVNKLETRVTLAFDVGRSPSLDEGQRATILARLATRITKEGVLRVTSQRHRTQGANRAAAIERFLELVAEALEPEIPRRPTRMPAGVRRKRLEGKRKRAEVKRQRRGVEE
jgi:ribosome-associated protein